MPDDQTNTSSNQDYSLSRIIKKIGKGLGYKLLIYFLILVLIIALLIWLYVQCILLMDTKSGYDKVIKFGLAPLIILALTTVTALIYVDIYTKLRREDEIIADITISGLKIEADKDLNNNLSRLVEHKLDINIGRGDGPISQRITNAIKDYQDKDYLLRKSSQNPVLNTDVSGIRESAL